MGRVQRGQIQQGQGQHGSARSGRRIRLRRQANADQGPRQFDLEGAKRPYQIKLDKKTDLLQTGDSADKAKTWVLLANFYDPSAVRNMLALDLGRALQMECNMGYRPVCLFYDGEFRGLYL